MISTIYSKTKSRLSSKLLEILIYIQHIYPYIVLDSTIYISFIFGLFNFFEFLKNNEF